MNKYRVKLISPSGYVFEYLRHAEDLTGIARHLEVNFSCLSENYGARWLTSFEADFLIVCKKDQDLAGAEIALVPVKQKAKSLPKAAPQPD